jgi:hypothetical protein
VEVGVAVSVGRGDDVAVGVMEGVKVGVAKGEGSVHPPNNAAISQAHTAYEVSFTMVS